MAHAKREHFKSAEVCELTELQPYVLRSWEAEFPGLGTPLGTTPGRMYRRADVELVVRIKQLVFEEGLTLAGARRQLDEEQQGKEGSLVAAAMDEMLSDRVRQKLRDLKGGLEGILHLLDHDRARPAELTLVAPAAVGAKMVAKRRVRR